MIKPDGLVLTNPAGYIIYRSKMNYWKIEMKGNTMNYWDVRDPDNIWKLMEDDEVALYNF